MSDQTPSAAPITTPFVPTTVVVDESVAKTAHRIARAKTFLKNSFKSVGVPVLIGTAAAAVATRRSNNEDSDSTESSSDTGTN